MILEAVPCIEEVQVAASNEPDQLQQILAARALYAERTRVPLRIWLLTFMPASSASVEQIVSVVYQLLTDLDIEARVVYSNGQLTVSAKQFADMRNGVLTGVVSHDTVLLAGHIRAMCNRAGLTYVLKAD